MKTELRRISSVHLEECLEVIKKSFETVAQELELTPQNCPKHTSFMPLEYLEKQLELGWIMIGLFTESKLIGYIALSQTDETTFNLHNLAVLPEYRRMGHGEFLLETAKKTAVSRGATKVTLKYLADSKNLKTWCESNGFVHTETKKIDDFPFEIGYMEWNE